jgi:sterol desaturase/sphingolipid hydroxylase (fatty acid hydroxylase superfamily)
MLDVLWDTRGYFFWLLVVSLGCLVAERIRPWRAGQKLLRREFAQDLVWLFFNGHYFAIVFAYATTHLALWIAPALHGATSLNLLGTQPLAVQFLAYFLLKDFLDWCVHNLLHRVPALWEFHKLHHSITEMDWIGNFRFHWLEIVVYQGITYLPLVMLGVDPTVLLLVAIAMTIIGHLNHSNIDLTYGPLRYVFNSPRMHIWHHAAETPPGRPWGVNFGVALSVWDWIFGTAHWPSREAAPAQQPAELGFRGLERFPKSLVGRFLYPLTRFWRK